MPQRFARAAACRARWAHARLGSPGRVQHGDGVRLGEGAHGGHEPIGQGLEHHRRQDRLALYLAQEPDHCPGRLQGRNVGVQDEPIDQAVRESHRGTARFSKRCHPASLAQDGRSLSHSGWSRDRSSLRGSSTKMQSLLFPVRSSPPTGPSQLVAANSLHFVLVLRPPTVPGGWCAAIHLSPARDAVPLPRGVRV
jgi:hypothetical protein